MIRLQIAKGFFIITDENGQVYPGWMGNDAPSYPTLEEPDVVYQKCMDKGLPPEKIIDIMLHIFHRQRFLRGGFLSEYDLNLGMVGPRGSGKSCGGCAIAIWDYLLCGVPVFSNMDIEVTVRFKEASKVFRSLELDETSLLNVKDEAHMYRRCLVFIDEANMSMAESHRTLGNKALWFSYALQQSRKRQLSLIHTEQSEFYVTERLRFQTNVYISCADAAYQYGIPKPGELGRKSLWKVYDYSGVLTGHIFDGEAVSENTFHMTPFWHSYDSRQLQTGEVELPDHKKKHGDIDIKEGANLAALKEQYYEASTIMANYGVKGEEVQVFCDELWKDMGIEGSRADQTRIGQQLAELGVSKRRTTSGRYFYIIPQKSDFGDNGG